MSETKSSPAAKVGLVTAIAIVVANMVGTGVFGSLGFQVAGLPSGFPIVMLWLIGGIISFCGAMCYAEIASLFPKSGGEYHLLSRTYSPWVGFLAGWLSITVGFAAPIALNATLLGKFMGNILEVNPLYFAIPTVVFVTLIHLNELKFIGGFQSLFTYVKVLLILVLGVLGFAIGTAQDISFLPKDGDMELIASSSFATSLVYVMYAYTGWNAATYMMDEVKQPTRIVPLALLIGTGLVTALYLLINCAFLYSTPIDDMKLVPEVGLVAAKSILGENGGKIMGILISFGLISTISSMTWAGPRVTAAIGRDHEPISFLARTNRNGVPALAILIQGAIVIVLVCTATFDQLINYVQVLLTISSLMVVLGIFYLRIRKPELKPPFAPWGAPITSYLYAGIFTVVSVYVLIFQIKERKTETLWGLATLLLGVIVFALMIAKEKSRPESKN